MEANPKDAAAWLNLGLLLRANGEKTAGDKDVLQGDRAEPQAGGSCDGQGQDPEEDDQHAVARGSPNSGRTRRFIDQMWPTLGVLDDGHCGAYPQLIFRRTQPIRLYTAAWLTIAVNSEDHAAPVLILVESTDVVYDGPGERGVLTMRTATA